MAERNYRRDDNIRQTGRYAYIDGSTCLLYTSDAADE